MNCQTVQSQLVEDLELRLEPEVADHLERCPTCRQLTEDLLELEDLSKSLSGRFRVPRTFRDEVLSQVETGRTTRLRSALLFVCVVSVLLVGFGFYRTAGQLTSLSESSSSPVKADLEELPGVPLSAEEVGGYVDVVVGEGSDSEMILRLPSVIKIHKEPVQEDFYIDHVSH